MLQPGQVSSGLTEQITAAILVVNIGTGDVNTQDQALRIHEQMAFASIHLLMSVFAMSPLFPSFGRTDCR